MTARDRGLGHALEIQKKHADPRDWKGQIDAIADPEEREVAREYLRGIWQRTKVVQDLQRNKGR